MGFGGFDLDDMPDELKYMFLKELKKRMGGDDDDDDDDEETNAIREAKNKGSQGALKPGQEITLYEGVGGNKRLENTSLGKKWKYPMVTYKMYKKGREAEFWYLLERGKKNSIRLAWCHAEHIIRELPKEQFEHAKREAFSGLSEELVDPLLAFAKETGHQDALGLIFAAFKGFRDVLLRDMREQKETQALFGETPAQAAPPASEGGKQKSLPA